LVCVGVRTPFVWVSRVTILWLTFLSFSVPRFRTGSHSFFSNHLPIPAGTPSLTSPDLQPGFNFSSSLPPGVPGFFEGGFYLCRPPLTFASTRGSSPPVALPAVASVSQSFFDPPLFTVVPPSQQNPSSSTLADLMK